MPDESFPNHKIVNTILQCVDRLKIDDDTLSETDLENSLSLYSNQNDKLSNAYNECRTLAKSILNKWYRARYNIKTSYDANGDFDLGWKKLQKQLDKERRRPSSDESDGDLD